MNHARFVLVVLATAIAVDACNPLHADEVAALGGETPGVPPGPLHRPGQPCLLCHDGAFGDPSAFSMAGTVFAGGNTLEPSVGATVTLQGADGTKATTTTNAAGNFYLTPDAYTPRYPVHVLSVVSVEGVAVTMHSHIGVNGSCAGCHVDPPGPDSPGHLYSDVTNVLGTSP